MPGSRQNLAYPGCQVRASAQNDSVPHVLVVRQCQPSPADQLETLQTTCQRHKFQDAKKHIVVDGLDGDSSCNMRGWRCTTYLKQLRSMHLALQACRNHGCEYETNEAEVIKASAPAPLATDLRATPTRGTMDDGSGTHEACTIEVRRHPVSVMPPKKHRNAGPAG